MLLLAAAVTGALTLIGIIVGLLFQRGSETRTRVDVARRHEDELIQARNRGQTDLAGDVIASWQAQVAGLRDEISASRKAAAEEIALVRAELRDTKAEHAICLSTLIDVRGRVAELEHRPLSATGPEIAELARSLTAFVEATKPATDGASA